MNRISFFNDIVIVILTAFLVASPAIAGPHAGKGKPCKAQKHKHGRGLKSEVQSSGLLVSISIGFEEARRLAVANHYIGYRPLPPGIRKNLARGKPLPPGIAKKVVPAPMLRQLPVYPGYEWRICGKDLVLVSVSTNIVAEILFGVFE